jgi:hypothetical protein
MKKTKITPKPKVKTGNVFIRSVSEEAKKKFYNKAEILGYKPKELFELLVKKL